MAYTSGKQAFLEILKTEGVSVMFGNPGTTELPLMDGLAREPGIRYVLALQEALPDATFVSMTAALPMLRASLRSVTWMRKPAFSGAMLIRRLSGCSFFSRSATWRARFTISLRCARAKAPLTRT